MKDIKKCNTVICSIIFLLLLSACNQNTDSEEGNYGDLFNTSTIVTGQVILQNTSEPIKNINIYFTEQGFGPDCDGNVLTNPVRFDSVETDTSGLFTKQISYTNIMDKICVESFAELSDGAEKFYSDTVEFVTTLKREPPFDTTSVTLKVGKN